MSNETKAHKIRAALAQLDRANDSHWTDDGLPTESAVREFANDKTISRKEIQDASPGFQRVPVEAKADPLTGQPEAEPAAGITDIGDPAKNTGELMSEDEVRDILQGGVKAAQDELVAAQQNVRDANARVVKAVAELQKARDEYSRAYPPMSPAQNAKEYIASEMAQRAAAHAAQHGYGNGVAPGSQVDAAFQRGNTRGWRRPSRAAIPTQSGANRAA